VSGKGGKPRKHPGVRGVRPDRKAQKRADAEARNALTKPGDRRAARR
jgi:hypothetical protein